MVEQRAGGSEIGDSEAACGQRETEEEEPQEVGTHRTTGIAAQRGRKNSDGEGKEKSVHENEDHAPEFAIGDAAHEQRDGEDRKNGEQAKEAVEGSCGELAEDYIVAFEFGEEEKAECAFAFFFTRQSAVERRPAARQ